MKRFLSVALILCLLMSGLPAFAAESKPLTAKATPAADFKYVTGATGLEITRYTGRDATVTVPAAIDGTPVVGIGEKAFQGRTSVTSVALPNSVKTVGARAFADCSKLRLVLLGNQTRTVGAKAFTGCAKLKSLLLPDSMTAMSASAFDAGRSIKLAGKKGSFAQQYVRKYAGKAKLTFVAYTELRGLAVQGPSTLVVGEHAEAWVELYPADTEFVALRWESSDPDVVSIDYLLTAEDDVKVVLTGMGAGKARIMVYGTNGRTASTDVTVTYGDVVMDVDTATLFEGSGKVNNTKLALLSSQYATAAYDQAKITAQLKADGYTLLSQANYPSKPGAYDYVAYSIASKKLTIADKEYTLYAVAVRGTATDEEWISNFDVGRDDDHKGFTAAMTEVLTAVKQQVTTPAEGNKFWITGHSRGAAVANMLTAKVAADKSLVAVDTNVYGYTFACPATTRKPAAGTPVFNYNGDEDIVPRVPLSWWGFSRHGVDYTLKRSDALYNPMKTNYKTLTGNEYTAASATYGKGIILAFYGTFHNHTAYDKFYKIAIGKHKATLIEIIGAARKGDTTTMFNKIGKLIKEIINGKESVDAADGPLTLADIDMEKLDQFIAQGEALQGVYDLFQAHEQEVYVGWMMAAAK